MFVVVQLWNLEGIIIYKEIGKKAMKGEYSNEFSYKMQVMSIFFLFAWKLLLPLIGGFSFLFLQPIILKSDFPAFTGITLDVGSISWDYYLGVSLILLAFLELLAIGIIFALFCKDTSICRKNVWTANTYYGHIFEMFIKLYILGDFIFNVDVNIILKQLLG